MGNSRIVVALGLALSACIKPDQVELRGLAREYDENELAAAEKYEGREVMVSGTVVRMGQDRRTVVEHEFDKADPFSAKSRRSSEVVPYVMLAPSDGVGGLAGLCFFDIADRSEVATLRKGQAVELSCIHGGYRPGRKPPTLLFKECSVEN